ncbi:MAG: aldehyde dehydrogenase family protein [Bacteroidales bacterium]|nr:aldehyde dehydrogenase family protein [Bacteroidales bacterium]
MNEVEIKSTSFAEIDKAINSLDAQKKKWAVLSVPEKIKMLLGVRKNIGVYAGEWVDLSVKAKQLNPKSALTGEEWSTGPWAFASTINNYIHTLHAIHDNRKDQLIKKVSTRKNGQVIAQVFPNNIYDHLLFNGIHAEIWMRKEVNTQNLLGTMGVFYREKDPVGKLSLVLGAGNINAIAPLDVLHKLLAEGEVVILKMNPVNAYLGPVLEKIFEEFIRADFLRLVYGGAEVGGYLTKHPKVGSIHITGSERTHDIIVYGPGKEGRERKAADKPILDPSKKMTSELGGIGPLIVVPGPWSKADIDFQAENIVAAKLHNGGHNCVASQILVLPRNWDLSGELIDAVSKKLKSAPPRIAYYPGAAQSQKAAVAAYPDAQQYEGEVPRTFITGLDANNPAEYSFTTEFFAPVYAQTFVEGGNASVFLENAVNFCNEKLHGTLGATLLVHPKTMKEYATDLDKAIAGLKYGAIGVNIWNAIAFQITQCTWGAFPGHTANDIQSGIGTVHNTFLFDKPEKSVIYGPFRVMPAAWAHGDFNLMPKPVWYVNNKTAHITAKRITRFAVNPGFKHLPGIFISAMRG